MITHSDVFDEREVEGYKMKTQIDFKVGNQGHEPIQIKWHDFISYLGVAVVIPLSVAFTAVAFGWA